jgi:hypothetical protein
MPALLMLLALLFPEILGPFWADPDYAYLLSALNLVQLHVPGFYFHPGISVQLLGALVIAGAWLSRLPFVGVSPQTDVLLHPELYLQCIEVALVVLSAATIFLFGWQLRRATQSIVVALVGQGTIFLAGTVASAWLERAEAENFLLFASTLLVSLVVPAAFSQANGDSARRSMAVGGAIGLCLAAKISTFPLVLAVLYLPSARARCKALIAALASAFVLTLPIIHQYRHLFRFYLGIAGHAGMYGEGRQGLPTLAELALNLASLFQAAPELFLGLAACGALVIAWTAARGWMLGARPKLFAVSGAIIVVQLAIVAKHPSAHYLVPIAAINALVAAGVANLVMEWRGWPRGGLALLGALLILLGLERQIRDTGAWLGEWWRLQGKEETLLATATGSGCALIQYYYSPTLDYKLSFANVFVDRYHGRALDALYPDRLFYDVAGHGLETYAGKVTYAQEIERLGVAKCVYLLGSEFDGPSAGVFPVGWLTLLARVPHAVGGSLALYELHRLPDGAWPDLAQQQWR